MTSRTAGTGMAAARFPVDKTLDEFNLAESSIGRASHDYSITLDWIHRADNLCLVGPAGTGKSHYLIALGGTAVEARLSGPLLHRRRAHRTALAGRRRQHRRAGDRDHLPPRAGHHRHMPTPELCRPGAVTLAGELVRSDVLVAVGSG